MRIRPYIIISLIFICFFISCENPNVNLHNEENEYINMSTSDNKSQDISIEKTEAVNKNNYYEISLNNFINAMDKYMLEDEEDIIHDKSMISENFLTNVELMSIKNQDVTYIISYIQISANRYGVAIFEEDSSNPIAYFTTARIHGIRNISSLIDKGATFIEFTLYYGTGSASVEYICIYYISNETVKEVYRNNIAEMGALDKTFFPYLILPDFMSPYDGSPTILFSEVSDGLIRQKAFIWDDINLEFKEVVE